MDKIQGFLMSLCLLMVARRKSDTDPKMEHIIPRIKASVIQGVLISIIVTSSIFLFKNTFITKNDVIEDKLEKIETLIITNQHNINKRMDKFEEGQNDINKRVYIIEGIIHNTKGWED